MADGESLKQVLAIIGVFGSPVVIVIAVLMFRLSRARELHNTIRQLAEKGIPIPPQLFEESNDARRPLRAGVALIALGLGLIVAFLTSDNAALWGVGTIPLLVGVGFLVVWRLENQPPA